MSGEGREEVDGQIDVDTGAVADTLGRHAAAVGNDAQRFMPAGENLVGLGAVLAGDEPDSATALVERAVIQPGVGVMRQRTILLAIRSRPTTAAEDAGAQKCCTEYAEDRPVPVAVTKDQKQTSLSECAERCDGEAREQRCQL